MAAARGAAAVEHKVCTLCRPEHDSARSVRPDRLAVESDEPGLVAVELEAVDARVGCVDEPQADALARPHAEGLEDRAVYGHRIADATGVARIHEAAEIAGDARLAIQPPIGQDPDDIPVHGGRFLL